MPRGENPDATRMFEEMEELARKGAELSRSKTADRQEVKVTGEEPEAK